MKVIQLVHNKVRDEGRGYHLLALLMAFVVACAPAGSIDEQAIPPTSAVDTTLPVPSGISLDDLEDILPPKPQFREFTRDDPPTFAEYEEAVFATVACIEALGHTVYGPGLSSDPDFPLKLTQPGIPSSQLYSFGVADPEPGAQPLMTVDAALEFCYEWGGYNLVSLAREPSEEAIRAWYEQFRACLVDIGIDNAENLSDEELRDGAYVDWPIECVP